MNRSFVVLTGVAAIGLILVLSNQTSGSAQTGTPAKITTILGYEVVGAANLAGNG